MYCTKCENNALVKAIIAYEQRGEKLPQLGEALRRIDELKARCTACHKRALRHNTSLDMDRNGGRKDSEFSYDFEKLKLLGSDLMPVVDPDFFALRKRDTTTGCTKLAEEVENELRIALASIMQLDPLELLLVQNYFNRKTRKEFCRTLRELRERLTKRYDLREKATSFRAVACFWSKKIVAKVPALAGVFEAAS